MISSAVAGRRAALVAYAEAVAPAAVAVAYRLPSLELAHVTL